MPGTAVFLTANLNAVPHALLHNLKHNKVLHERNVLLTVEMLETPIAEDDERTEITALGDEFYRLTLRFGFAEDPDVPVALDALRSQGPGLRHDGHDVLPQPRNHRRDRSPRHGALARQAVRLHARNATPATAFFQIPGNRLIELGTQVEI